MNKQLNWLTPIALICSASTCFAAQYLTIEEGQKVCFPNATRFEVKTLTLSPEQKKRLDSQLGITTKSKPLRVWMAYNESVFLGRFIFDDVIGKHNLIDYALALNPDGSIKQIEILTYREAYGSDIRKESWRNQFEGKTSSSPFKLQKDIKNITGATLSCRHVSEGVKRILVIYDIALKKKV